MLQDIRLAIRQMRKNPGFTVVAVLSLALGIGANTTVLSWIKSALLRPIAGAAESDRLVVVCARHSSGATADTISYPDLQDLAAETNVFAGLIGSQIGTVSIGAQGDTDWVWAETTTGNFFDLLGVPLKLGRGFSASDDVGRAGQSICVISDSLWQRRFAGSPQALGRTLEINQRPFTIVGVTPPEFHGTMSGLRLDLWVPLADRSTAGFTSIDVTRRADRWLHTLARLQPGVSLSVAQGAGEVVMRRLAATFPDTNRNQGIKLFPLWASPYGAQAIFLPLLQVLVGVTLLVFLLVIANLANLLLARATVRSREVAVRLAVGASRARLMRQLLTESVVLAAAGGALGFLVASWSLRLLFKLMPETYLPVGYDLQLGGLELTSTIGLTLAGGLLFGLAPAWQSGRTDLNTILKEGGRAEAGRSGRHRLRGALVVAEIALALMLLVAAGLCTKSFDQARGMNPGFNRTGVWLAGFRLRAHGYDDETGTRYSRQLRDRLTTAPGVEAAAMADWLPLGFEGGSAGAMKVDGYAPAIGENVDAGVAHVSPDYFRALQIPLLDGRDFRDSDQPNAPRVIVVNETFVKRFLPDRTPLGIHVQYWGRDSVIVGVVAAGKYRSLSEPARPFVYDCAWQNPNDHLTAVVRMKGDAGAAAQLIRREAAAIDPGVRVWVGLSLAQFTEAAYAVQRVAARLLLALGAVALALAVMGIYGVMAFTVNQRTRELGIRIALGAQRHDVWRLVLKQGFRLAIYGTAAGLLGAAAASRLISSLLIGVHALDPLVIVSATVGLMAVALLACWIPARRAARLDPIIALRHD